MALHYPDLTARHKQQKCSGSRRNCRYLAGWLSARPLRSVPAI